MKIKSEGTPVKDLRSLWGRVVVGGMGVTPTGKTCVIYMGSVIINCVKPCVYWCLGCNLVIN